MAYNDFTEMPVWQLGYSIVQEVYALTEKLPKSEDYALKGQLRDASMSITGNIAEAFGRHHAKDKINFYYFSRASAFEIKSHLICGSGVGYFAQYEIDNIILKCSDLIEEINKIIKTLSNGIRN